MLLLVLVKSFGVSAKTHLRNMIIVPEMISSIIGIYDGKMFCGVEMKPEMIGMYFG
jgi:small subunit ribosomal protein S15e